MKFSICCKSPLRKLRGTDEFICSNCKLPAESDGRNTSQFKRENQRVKPKEEMEFINFIKEHFGWRNIQIARKLHISNSDINRLRKVIRLERQQATDSTIKLH